MCEKPKARSRSNPFLLTALPDTLPSCTAERKTTPAPQHRHQILRNQVQGAGPRLIYITRGLAASNQIPKAVFNFGIYLHTSVLLVLLHARHSRWEELTDLLEKQTGVSRERENKQKQDVYNDINKTTIHFPSFGMILNFPPTSA